MGVNVVGKNFWMAIFYNLAIFHYKYSVKLGCFIDIMGNEDKSSEFPNFSGTVEQFTTLLPVKTSERFIENYEANIIFV